MRYRAYTKKLASRKTDMDLLFRVRPFRPNNFLDPHEGVGAGTKRLLRESGHEEHTFRGWHALHLLAVKREVEKLATQERRIAIKKEPMTLPAGDSGGTERVREIPVFDTPEARMLADHEERVLRHQERLLEMVILFADEIVEELALKKRLRHPELMKKIVAEKLRSPERSLNEIRESIASDALNRQRCSEYFARVKEVLIERLPGLGNKDTWSDPS